MKPSVFLFSFLVLFLTAQSPSYGQQDAPKELRTTTAIESDLGNWKKYSSNEGRFSVDFPGTPKLSTEEAGTPSGKFTVNKCNVTTLAEYGVIYTDFPTKIDGSEAANAVLDNGAKAAVSRVKSKLLSITEINVGGYPGRLLKEEMRDGSIMYAKMILAGQRLYQVAVTMPSAEKISENQTATYQDAADKFLNSFRLILK
ncbi:MAG: hypothetical protein C5B55_03670 [Blastocatellia bacterium]|nr:MAG: hypothetical protein C5B55_03670 [Blastocatellia bacterium]